MPLLESSGAEPNQLSGSANTTTSPRFISENNAPSDSKFNVTVPQGYIWVMGDHRGASADSRFHTDDVNKGMVPLTKVVGRAAFANSSVTSTPY